MASPPFTTDATNPADTGVVSAFPANERTYRDMQDSVIEREHDFASGHHEFGIGSSATRDAITDWVNGALWYNTDLGYIQIRQSGSWISAGPVEPSGVVKAFAGSSAPSGYLLCDGSAVSRTTYAALFAVVSTTFGAGDGSTTFNVPDLRGRVIAGVDGGAGRLGSGPTGGVTGSATLGATGGEQAHAQTSSELATHTHGITDPGHAHSISGWTFATNASNTTSMASGGTPETGNTNSATTGVSVQNAGSGTAANVTQPTLVLNYIIKT